MDLCFTDSMEIAPSSARGYTIPKDVYEKYESMTLSLSYSWQGEMMSMRVIDLFTHEDLVPAYPSKSK